MSEPFPFTRAERAEFEDTPLSTVATVDPTVAPVSDDQAALLASGAAPVVVDVAALHAQIQAMQARMDAMNVAETDWRLSHWWCSPLSRWAGPS
jgi:hypothetical protein